MSINIGLIGYGYWGKILAKYLDENPCFDLQRIFGRSLTKAGRQTNGLWDILSDTDVQAVVVATPIGTHYEIVKQALESGKHVFCEKPLCISGIQAEELRDLAKEKGLSLFVDLTYTFSPALELALNYVNAGKIGGLSRIEVVIKKHGKASKYGNVYWMLGVHALSIVNMFSPLEGLNFMEMECDREIQSASLIFREKVTGHIDISMVQPAYQKQVVLYGTKGTIMYNPYGRDWTLRFCTPWGDNTTDIYTDECNNLRYVVEYFEDVLLHDYPSNVDEAVRITKIIEAMLC